MFCVVLICNALKIEITLVYFFILISKEIQFNFLVMDSYGTVLMFQVLTTIGLKHYLL